MAMKHSDPGDYDLDTPEGMASAIAWTEYHISLLRDGALWFVPRSHSVYKMDKTRKVAIKMMGFPEPSITRVLAAIGWRVIKVHDGTKE